MSNSKKHLYSSKVENLNNSYINNTEIFFNTLRQSDLNNLKNVVINNNLIFWQYYEDGYNTALHVATLINKQNFIRWMIEYIEDYYSNDVAKVNKVINEWINIPNNKGDLVFHYLSGKGNIDIIEYLAKYEINYMHKNKQGNTVMHYAAQGNQSKSIIYFKHKFNLNCEDTNTDKSTPLHWACYNGNEEVIEYMIKYIKNINAKDNDGLTALHLSVLSENISIIKKLIFHNADRISFDNKQRLPIDIAKQEDLYNIVDILDNKLTCDLFSLRQNVKYKTKNRAYQIIFVISYIFKYFFVFQLILPGFNELNLLIIYSFLCIITFILFIWLSCTNSLSDTIENDNTFLYVSALIYYTK